MIILSYYQKQKQKNHIFMGWEKNCPTRSAYAPIYYFATLNYFPNTF